jgi:hypothetical protein
LTFPVYNGRCLVIFNKLHLPIPQHLSIKGFRVTASYEQQVKDCAICHANHVKTVCPFKDTRSSISDSVNQSQTEIQNTNAPMFTYSQFPHLPAQRQRLTFVPPAESSSLALPTTSVPALEVRESEVQALLATANTDDVNLDLDLQPSEPNMQSDNLVPPVLTNDVLPNHTVQTNAESENANAPTLACSEQEEMGAMVVDDNDSGLVPTSQMTEAGHEFQMASSTVETTLGAIPKLKREKSDNLLHNLPNEGHKKKAKSILASMAASSVNQIRRSQRKN